MATMGVKELTQHGAGRKTFCLRDWFSKYFSIISRSEISICQSNMFCAKLEHNIGGNAVIPWKLGHLLPFPWGHRRKEEGELPPLPCVCDRIRTSLVHFHVIFYEFYKYNDDGDESKSYVRPLLQLETVTNVLVIRSDKQFSFQITTERGCKMAAA